MDEYLLLGKKIILSKSEIVLDYHPDERFLDHFEVMAGEWSYCDGSLVGIERGNQGGILLTKQSFDFDVMLSFDVATVLPATRDLNAVWCTKWDTKTDYLGDSYVCGLNGWYENKSGIEKNGANGFNATTTLYNYEIGTFVNIKCGSINGHCFMFVDDKLITEVFDPFPLKDGRVGFSPYCTILKIKNIKIYKTYWEERKQSYEPEFK